MANVTINSGAVLFNVINTSTSRVAMANLVLDPGANGTLSANRVVGDYYRALELSNLVAANIIAVQLNGVNFTAGQLLELDTGLLSPPSFTNITRPAAADVGAGYSIWNTDDGTTNVSDGTNWLDPDGAIT
jgi:hypothetical protein